MVIYNGLMFKHDSDQKVTAARFEHIEITEFIIETLISKYENIKLSLAPQFEDIRPFQWHHHYESDALKRFDISVRYTSYLDISEFRTQGNNLEMPMFQEMERRRRRYIKEFYASNMSLKIGDNVDNLIANYRSTLSLQGIDVSEKKLSRMKYLILELIENDKAFLLDILNGNNDIIYSIVFCFDIKRAYALFAAGNTSLNSQLGGTVAYWESFRHLSQTYQINEVDMEGINSPKGGRFKLGFGGDIKVYYEVNI